MSDKTDYKASLNLPKTDFPMKADLVKNEPARLARWESSDLYGRLMKQRASAQAFILHDGPPFANGDIHIGHVVNKTLKDVVMRYKSMRGLRTPYVPGWDCHGLPIEHKIQEEIGPKWREMPVTEIRKRCFEYAQSYVVKQSEQFRRIGILGNWAEPYRTMAPEYEAATLEIFSRFVERGLVYRQLKPVNWSIENQTALAEADLEYKDVVDTSVFVEFSISNPGAFKAKFDLREDAKLNFLIWTTTPWTLPANLAIAAGPTVEYALVKFERNDQLLVNVVAVDLVGKVFARTNFKPAVLKTVSGSALEGIEYTHPFVDRNGKVVLADYVTTTDGTGLVHTAPGHGDEDYQTGRQYKLDVYCPVLGTGRFDDTVPEWLRGQSVWKGDELIIAKLGENGALFASEKFSHSYPHDARSKRKTIYRATEQWFVGVDKPFSIDGGSPSSIRERAMKAVENDVTFYPDWGRARIKGMLESRPDWVLSRQRAWGLPIPIFFNEKDQPLLKPESIRAVAKKFKELGSDAWFNLSVDQLLEGVDTGTEFPKSRLRKGSETFDVWFESGNSWFCVVEQRSNELGHTPVDLYLEGSDQHRGWFQLSLLPSLAIQGKPPFKSVLTHGFVVKPDGTKVSKSDKEYVKAMDEINRHGVDLIRLYVCSLDYQGDMPASPKLLADFGDKYRKIRNTIRYLLSNIDDFDPSRHRVGAPDSSLDAWMNHELSMFIEQSLEAYDTYKFHVAFRLIHDFCAVQISSVYGNAMKDRLYCEKPDSELRRRAQTVMYDSLVALIKLLAPMCVFTADEAWEFLKHKPSNESSLDSVHLTLMPTVHQAKSSAGFDLLMKLRDDALLQLDGLKKSVGLNKALDAEAVYSVADDASKSSLEKFGVDLEDLVGCGFHSIVVDPSVKSPGVKIVDRRETYQACARSWKRRPDIGADGQYPDLCQRDAQAVRSTR